MCVDIRVLDNLEAVEHPQEHKVQLAVGQQRAGAHAVAQAVGKQRRIRLLEPSLWPERLGVGPDVGI